MDPQEDCASGRKRGAVAREVSGGPATPCGVFTSGSQRQEKDGGMVICGGTIRLRLLVREKHMFSDCSIAATGDGVNDFAGRDETSSSELG